MAFLAGGLSLSAQNHKTSSAFAIDENIISFEVDSLVDKKIIVHQIDQDETITTITLIMAEGTDVTSMNPVITLAPGASITQRMVGAQDFSKQVTYTVTARDGTTSTYLFLAYAHQEIMRGGFYFLIYNNPGGTTYPGPGLYNWDTSLKFYCESRPNNSYMLDTWYVNSYAISNAPNYNDYLIPECVLLATFKIIPPSISGSSYICYGSPQSFSVTNAPSGFTWSKSSNLSISSTTSSTITVSAANSSSQGAGWVSINHGGAELKRFNVWIGTPTISISGPSSVTVGQPGSSNGNTFLINTSGYTGPVPTSYQWVLSPSNSGTLYDYGNYVNVYFTSSGSSRIEARACNTCGWGPWAFHYIDANRNSAPSVYPNPVDDILYVEVGSSANVNAQSAITVYDIRLYDGNGIIVRQTSHRGSGTARLDVSSLPNGNYYLHIYDGVNRTPEMHQIIVRH